MYYNGTAWTAVSGTASPLTTKGDLYTYSTTNARLPVGSDGQTLVANSAQTTGLAYTNNFAAGKNAIINGDFGVWQRGTSFTISNLAGSYTADRFLGAINGSTAGTNTVTQQTFTPGTAPVAGYEGSYFARFTTTTLGTGQSLCDFKQYIEDVRKFAGQTITVSFWMKSSVAATITGFVSQNFGSGGSTTVDTGITFTGTTSTSWQRFSASVAVPSISGKTIGTSSYLQILIRNGSVIAGSTTDIWGVQVEAGSVATAFQTATGTVQGELAACRRYLPTIENTAATAQDSVIGYALAANYAVYYYGFDVIARVPPTGITATGTIQGYGLNTAYTFTPAFNSGTPNGVTITAASGVTITAGQGSRIILGAGAKILFTGCEL
jgi:hypothetical protein